MKVFKKIKSNQLKLKANSNNKKKKQTAIVIRMKNISTLGRTNPSNLSIYPLSLGVWGGELQRNPQLLSVGLFPVVVWVKQLWNYFRCVVGLSKRFNDWMLLGAGVLTVEEGTYTYETEKARGMNGGHLCDPSISKWCIIYNMHMCACACVS